MLLNGNLSQSCNFNVKINDNKIKHTTCTKYLGMYIDQHLSWTDHIPNLEIKLSQSVAMFYRIRYYLSNNALWSVHYSLTYSHLQYAIGVWGGDWKTALIRLSVLHNKVLRAMTYSSYRSRVSPLHKNLNLLKINDIYILEIGKFMHNLHNLSSRIFEIRSTVFRWQGSPVTLIIARARIRSFYKAINHTGRCSATHATLF